MSRIGKKIIELPEGVDVSIQDNTIIVKGKLGELSQELLDFVTLEQKDRILELKVEDENNKFQRSMWGTSRSLVANLVHGVTNGFKQKVELNGVGYKMALQGANLVLNIGYSHPVIISIPEGIMLKIDKNELLGESINKQLIGDFFTRVHNLKPADPYKHKGFKLPGRFYRKKVGKKAK